MVPIAVVGGLVAFVDPEDVDLVTPYNWRPRTIHGVTYATAYVPESWQERRQRETFMHRLIMNAERGQTVDHRNGNGMLNTKANLRLVTPVQHSYNRAAHRSGTSQYKGVSWHTRRGKWVVQIRYDGKHHFIGYFDDEVEAALAYDEAAKRGQGEYARLNFPGG